MPYRLQGNCVQEQKEDQWHDLKCYDTHEEALAYLRALEANVEDVHKGSSMSDFVQFCPLVKVDYSKRLIYGRMTQEIPDGSREIMDYASSKPNFVKWSEAAKARTALLPEGDQSLGNLRLMHQPIAVGKVIDIEFKDAEKAVDIGTYVANDDAWEGVLKGVYTGFSIGGSYERKWMDSAYPSCTRYTAKPVEVSLVDSPAVPTAVFTMIKADGTEELHKLGVPLDVEPLPAVHAVGTPLNPPATPPAVRITGATQPIQNALPGATVTENLATWTPQVVETADDEPKPIPNIAGFLSPNLIENDAQPATEPQTVPLDINAVSTEQVETLKAFIDAVHQLAALKKAADDEKAAAEVLLKALGSRVGISRREGEPLAQPNDYPRDPDDYGDPANWSWPCDSTERCQRAMAYFNAGKGRDNYSDREWHVLGRRIAQRSAVQFGKRALYRPESNQIEMKEALPMELKKDIDGLMQQINAALTVGADEVGKDPAAVKQLLMQVLGHLQASDNATVADVNGASPKAPDNGGGQGDGVGKADGSMQPPMTAALTETSSSAEAEGTPTESAPKLTEDDANKALFDRVDALTATVAKLIEQMSAAKAEPTAPVNKNAPAGDLAALLNQAAPAADPVLEALMSGDVYALQKAASLAGSPERPDVEAVLRKAREAAVSSLTPTFTQMMLAQGLGLMPTFGDQQQ